MTWVVKFKDGIYQSDESHNICPRQQGAHRFLKRNVALLHASWWADHYGARIVRLKPRAKLDEAAIRRAERERVADKFCDSRNDLYYKIQAVREDGPLYGTIRDAILALDWPERKA